MSRAQKILKICYEFPPLGGGGAKVVNGLSANLVKKGYQIDLVTMGFKGLVPRETVDGINLFRCFVIRTNQSVCYAWEMIPYLITCYLKASYLLRHNKYRLNHTHFIFPDGIISYLLFKTKGLRYIITAHGSDVPGYNPDRFNFLHTVLGPIWKVIARNAETIVCPSESIKSLIHQADPNLHTTVIPNGINIDKFQPNRKKVDSVLVVTRMFERKGVQYLLKALETLDHKYEIHIVGDGPYLKTLKGRVDEKNLDVTFWGFLENQSKEIRDLYETSRIFILPSEAENFPIVLLEAMAAGMAIITTAETGCAEVVGEAGILVPPKNSNAIKEALERLIHDPELCNHMGRQARNRLEEHFSWSAVASQYSGLYENVV